MADTAQVTSNHDDAVPPPDEPAEPAPRKPLNSSWLFTVAGGLIGVYFLVSGAWMVRDKHGDGVFALLMIGIIGFVAVVGLLLFRSYRAERAARK